MPLLCQLCGQPADVTPTLCRCGAVAFCSQRHLLLACRNMLHTAQACQRMRQQLTRAQQVLHHDLQWPTLQVRRMQLRACLTACANDAHPVIKSCQTAGPNTLTHTGGA
jgi:hypothetical protein